MTSPAMWWMAEPWAIEPQALVRLIGSDPSGETAARFASDDSPAAPRYTVTPEGVARITIEGPLSARPSWFGGTTYEQIGTSVRAADADSQVERIELLVDSPGGAVSQVAETAETIRAASKPIIARVSGMAASAAYWLSAAADRIVASPTALVGSVGVIFTAYDHARRDAARGRHEFTSAGAPQKNASPATEAGAEQYQRLVDDVELVFHAALSGYRDLPAGEVAERYGDGAIMSAQRALTAGMIDEIETTTGGGDMSKADIEALNAELAESKTVAQALTAERNEAKAALSVLTAERDELRGTVAAMTAAVVAERGNFEARIGELEAERDGVAADAYAAARAQAIEALAAGGRITPAQVESGLAGKLYDLEHAAGADFAPFTELFGAGPAQIDTERHGSAAEADKDAAAEAEADEIEASAVALAAELHISVSDAIVRVVRGQ